MKIWCANVIDRQLSLALDLDGRWADSISTTRAATALDQAGR